MDENNEFLLYCPPRHTLRLFSDESSQQTAEFVYAALVVEKHLSLMEQLLHFQLHSMPATQSVLLKWRLAYAEKAVIKIQ